MRDSCGAVQQSTYEQETSTFRGLEIDLGKGLRWPVMTLSSVSHRARAAEHRFKTIIHIPLTEIATWAELPSGSGTRLSPLEVSAGDQAVFYLTPASHLSPLLL